MFERHDRVRREPELHVLTSVFDSPRFRSRWKLYEDFRKRIEEAGAVLWTVEVAFGDRDWVVTDPSDPRHLRLRTGCEVWHKERALNLLLQRLPESARYVAWIDADVQFLRDDWADETVHELQRHPVVQPWSEALDLSHLHELARRFRSFAWCRLEEPDAPTGPGGGTYCPEPAAVGSHRYWHPGYAWAARREVLDALGGLFDKAIVGAGDFLMARALIGRPHLPDWLGAGGKREMAAWAERADRIVRGDLGYVSGAVAHHWHGPKAARVYQDREAILRETGFDPDVDLVQDTQGLYRLTARSRELRDRLRRYFHGRDEDATS